MILSQHYVEDFSDSIDIDGFGDDFIDFACPSTLDKVFFNVASAGHNHRLGSLLLSVEVS